MIGPRGLRIALAAVVALDLIGYLFFIAAARADWLADGRPLSGLLALVSQPLWRTLVGLGGLAAIAAFARAPARLAAGAAALAALMVLATTHAQFVGSPWRHLFFSGLCLAGWLVGLAAGRARGTGIAAEQWARCGALGFLGAAYFNSGASKLVYGGVPWLGGVPLQAAMIGQSGLVPGGTVGLVQDWVASTPWMAAALSVATVLFELAGPLMLVGPRLRAAVAFGLIAMHVNILVLTTHILYWESMALLALFGLSADAPLGGQVAAPPRWLHGRRFAAAVIGLVALAAAAMAQQGIRAVRDDAPPPPDTAAPLPTAAPLQRLGPLALGQVVADSWTVTALAVRDDALTVTLSGPSAAATFALTCGAYQSPFDVGEGRILYPNDVPFAVLEPAGRALQELVRTATGGEAVCAHYRAWRTAAGG